MSLNKKDLEVLVIQLGQGLGVAKAEIIRLKKENETLEAAIREEIRGLVEGMGEE